MNKHKLLKALLLLMILCVTTIQITAQKRSLNRDEIEDKYKWDLTDIYANWDEWEKGMTQMEALMESFPTLKGTLADGPEALLKALKQNEEIDLLSYYTYRYPQFSFTVNQQDQEAKAKLQRVQIMFSKFGTATAWMEPELLQIPWETMEKWLAETPELAPYKFDLEDLYRQQTHILDEEKEKLLSYYSQINGKPAAIYSDLSTTDIEFPEVVLSGGDTTVATSGNYSFTLATNRNQADRKKMFEAHYNTYKEKENTYATIYDAVCQKDWANAQARNYNSSLESYLEDDNVPVEVYESLVNSVKSNTGPLQRYAKVRAKILGLEEYHQYDGSIPIIDFDKTYPYEEAKEIVLKSVLPLGETYQKQVEEALAGGWIDVFENTGKRGGAFSANVYGVHPYMLLNYNETMDYVFTLAHEMGHTMHTMLANQNQPFATSSYTIFVAEVASTFNERLLLDYWLNKTEDPKERISLLVQTIKNIAGTFYFQTLLADFELQVHQLAEEGQPITAAVLNKIMEDLFVTYHGNEAVNDDLFNVVWARIPHIYRTPFYVYQYATCFASSAQLYTKVFEAEGAEREAALEKYFNLLKSGGNDYPMEQLKNAGVDLTKKETFLAVINQFDELVTKLEVEVAKLEK